MTKPAESTDPAGLNGDRPLVLHNGHRLPLGDMAAMLDEELHNFQGLISLDLIEELHRFNNAERITCLQRGSFIRQVRLTRTCCTEERAVERRIDGRSCNNLVLLFLDRRGNGCRSPG